MQNYIYSDLALECDKTQASLNEKSAEISESDLGIAKLLSLKIDTEELSQKYQRPKGTYVTLSSDKIWLMSESELEAIAEITGCEISNMISALVPSKKKQDIAALVVGLGNSDITPDAIGPLTVSHLTVTRHLTAIDPTLFSKTEKCTVSAFIPGVLAQTGIETLELIRGAVQNVSPDVVIAVDALAARSCERLASTVQISDVGINPGSGIGNMRKAITKKTLGVPVIAIGVPTVVDSATLVYDALRKAGINEISQELCDVLENGKNFFVSPKDCDLISNTVGVLLARSLDRAFSLN